MTAIINHLRGPVRGPVSTKECQDVTATNDVVRVPHIDVENCSLTDLMIRYFDTAKFLTPTRQATPPFASAPV